MASDVVQFREDRALVTYLKGRGINPNEFAREAFERSVRGLRVREAMEKLRAQNIRIDFDVAQVIREERDSR